MIIDMNYNIVDDKTIYESSISAEDIAALIEAGEKVRLRFTGDVGRDMYLDVLAFQPESVEEGFSPNFTIASANGNISNSGNTYRLLEKPFVDSVSGKLIMRWHEEDSV